HRADFTVTDYIDHINQAPMFFVSTPSGLVDAEGMTFSQFNRDGFRGQTATLDDFRLHNSTIFTDARLKGTVELRTVDAQDPQLVPTALALICGLLFCEGARRETLYLLGDLDTCCYRETADRLAREGLTGRLGAHLMQELAAQVTRLAASGLRNCFEDGE